MLFNSTTAVRTVDCISVQLLEHYNIKGLILDLDNTLTTHDNPIPAQNVDRWLDEMRKNNIKMMIVSNNHYERVKPFADNLGLEFVCEGKKPLSKGFNEAQKRMGIPFENIAAVGDQIFTDILGANLRRIKSIYVSRYSMKQQHSLNLKDLWKTFYSEKIIFLYKSDRKNF